MRAELDGIICSGGRRGKQFTYALLDERAPQSKTLAHDEALAELARRYFTSHGPASLHDFVWWSGLTVKDAQDAIEMISSELEKEEIEGKIYWFGAESPLSAWTNSPTTACLLPNYDEYIVGYKDRSAILNTVEANKLDPRGNVLFSHTMLINGKIAGIWKRTFKKSAAVISIHPITTLNHEQMDAFILAVQRFSRFLGMPIEISA